MPLCCPKVRDSPKGLLQAKPSLVHAPNLKPVGRENSFAERLRHAGTCLFTVYRFCVFALGVTASSHLFDYGSTANGGDSSFYTSLISDVHYTTPRDSTYFTGIYQQENSPIPCSGSTEGFNTLGHPVQDVSGFESRGLFSSDSGIEMTPAESTEVDKTLADPMKVEAYKYMDISRSEEIKYQEKRDSDSEDESPGLIDKYQGTPAKPSHAAEPQRTASESMKGAKEQAPLEDTRSGDQHSTSVVTAPVKITLTEIESAGEAVSKESSPTQPETGLKPSHEVVPTVTVSEPEDDSPGSVTPPSSGTGNAGAQPCFLGFFFCIQRVVAVAELRWRITVGLWGGSKGVRADVNGSPWLEVFLPCSGTTLHCCTEAECELFCPSRTHCSGWTALSV